MIIAFLVNDIERTVAESLHIVDLISEDLFNKKKTFERLTEKELCLKVLFESDISFCHLERVRKF